MTRAKKRNTLTATAMLAPTLAAAAPTAVADERAIAGCWWFVDAGLLCDDCQASGCSMRIDYQSNACEESQATVCRHWFRLEFVPNGGRTKRLVMRTCAFVTECAAVWPCDGQACDTGRPIADQGAHVSPGVPGRACFESEPGEGRP